MLGLLSGKRGLLAGAVMAVAVLSLAGAPQTAAQEDLRYAEVSACVDPERGPDHEECVCEVLRSQDVDYLLAYRAQHGSDPGSYPSGLRYDGDAVSGDFERDKEFKSQCAMTYFREDLRRGWKFAVFVGFGLFTMSLAWGGYVYMQESAAAEQRAQSRGIIFRVMGGLAIVVMAFFLWSMFSELFLDLGTNSLWQPEYEDTIRRPDW